MDNSEFENAAAEVEVDEATLAAIDKGLKAVEDGLTVSLDETRKLIIQFAAKQ